MKLIVDIPEDLYEECKHTELSKEIEGLPFHIIKLVANGTPLRANSYRERYVEVE